MAMTRDYLPEPGSTRYYSPPAGSPEKIEILRTRVELGLPLWHDKDR